MKEKVRTLIVAGSARFGSGESLLFDYLLRPEEKIILPVIIFPEEGPLVEKARESGLEVLVIPGKDYLTDFYRLWKQPLAWVYNLGSFVKTSRVIRNRRIQLVISWSFLNWTGALSARQEGIPHIWMIREVLSRRAGRLNFFWGRWLASQLANDLSVKVLLESKAVAKMFARKRTREKAEILPPAIDGEKFLAGLSDWSDEANQGSDVALFINVLDFEKIEKIIRAVMEAFEKKNQKKEKDKIVLFFPGLEKEKIKILKKKLFGRGLNDQLKLDFPECWSWPGDGKRFCAAIFLPGFDPLTRLVLEAGLSLIPVFVEDSPASELLVQGKTGFVFKDDYQELANNLSEVMKDKNYRQSIGVAARQHFIQNYSLQTWKVRFEKIVEESLSLP